MPKKQEEGGQCMIKFLWWAGLRKVTVRDA